ncbi:MAG: pyrroline-5-carboxylate reductase [Deltaproteobacteria bacterium]|nr:pyrroline-5-carboxylate reductase [Deltaproteobacteria bacterium]MBN2673555.1 pyrroline-5-carboxylate reductase [Deltaproteobacteria bacterium]
MKLGILGCGQMGEAILKGLLAADAVNDTDVVLTTKFDNHEQELKQRYPKMLVTQNNQDAAMRSDFVILATNPQAAKDVLESCTEELKGKIVVSICAGIMLDKLMTWAPTANVLRVMPNTPCVIGEGTIAISSIGVVEEVVAKVKTLFSNLGLCTVLDEKYLDVFTALASSGPAFAFVILEALADGAVMMGMPREIAAKLTAQMLQGSARLLLETGEHPAALKDQVTTPGGITTAGLLVMEDGRIRSTLARTIQKASVTAHKLGDE